MQGTHSNPGLLKWLGAITFVFGLSLVLVFSGLLDRFSGSARIPRDIASQSVALYWTLSCMLVCLVSFWRSHRAQLLLAIGSCVFTVKARLTPY
jgi:hypothetical protein